MTAATLPRVLFAGNPNTGRSISWPAAFVAQLGIVHSLGETNEESAPLRESLANEYPAHAGLALMFFLLIATPCMATLAITRRESGRWSWALLQFGGLTALGYVIAVITYQLGQLLA